MMIRAPFIEKYLHVLCLFLLVGTTMVSAHTQEKKNVLLIMADDFNHWIRPIGYYDQAKTPNINALAGKGVLFNDASSTSPVCSPSRQAIMSGLRGTTTGIDSNKAPYFRDVAPFDKVVTLNQYFKDAGYYAYAGGKIYHKSTMGDRITDPENWSGFTDQNSGGGPSGTSYNWASDTVAALKWSGNDKDVETTGDRKLARHFETMLKGYDRSEPFFMAVGLFRPHLPWNVPKEYYTRINREGLTVPKGFRADDYNDTPYGSYTGYDEVIAEDEYKNMLQAYLANMAYTDDNVGILLKALEANQRIAENTVVVFMGDHGWSLGEKNQLQKGNVFDQASRTTLIIYDSEAEGNGQISRKTVSLQDVYPTLTELTGLPSREVVEGNSLVPLLTSPNANSWDKPIFISLDGRDIIKTSKYRYIKEKNSDRNQLYAIRSDPFEFTNLIDEESYADDIVQLERTIADMKKQGQAVKARVGNEDDEIVADVADISDLNAVVSDAGAVLSWTDVDGETGYRVRRFKGTEAQKIADLEADSESFTDTTAIANTAYTYVVRPMVENRAVATSNRVVVNAIEGNSEVSDRVRVVGPVAGIPRSQEYRLFVSDAETGSFEEAHVHYSEAREKDFEWGSNFYLPGFRMSFANFEFAEGAAYAKVALPEGDVPDFEVRPVNKKIRISYRNENGKRVAILRFPEPNNAYKASSYISVVPLVDGVADTKNGLGIFANPFQEAPTDNIVTVKAGDTAPSASNLLAGQTVVFEPGAHDIGIGYGLKSNVDYYFANGAYVKGTFEKRSGSDAILENVKVYGYGILSTNHLKRFRPDGTKYKYNPVELLTSSNVRIEGITFEDPSHHTLNIGGKSDNAPVYVGKVKIIGWRANGDGVHIVGRGTVEDCFVRTQDDCMYIASEMTDVKIRRMVTWTDFNGSAMIFTANGGGENVTVSDSDIIYMRSRFNSKTDVKWADHKGGHAFNLRSLGQNKVVQNITVEDIRIDDDKPEKALFYISMTPSEVSPDATNYSFKNITFKNIQAVTNGDYENTIRAQGSNFPEDITFECVKVGDDVMNGFQNWAVSNIEEGQIDFLDCSGQANTTAKTLDGAQPDSLSVPEKDIIIWPNPAETVFTVVKPESSGNFERIELLDVNGRSIQSFDTFRPENKASQIIELGALIKGTYVVRTTLTDGIVHSSKLLVK